MLKRLWSLPLEHPARGVALAREANRLAAWDEHWLFWTNRDGQRQAQARFADGLVAAADLGWLAAFDAEKTEPVWRDTPVANIADLAVTVSGGRVALACFSEGLRLYQDGGKARKPEAAVPPCRLVALSHDGGRLVV